MIKLFVCLLAFTSVIHFQAKVYICRSGTSYAYHNKLCQGLRNCAHQLDTVTVAEAVRAGKGKPCGYCYKKGR